MVSVSRMTFGLVTAVLVKVFSGPSHVQNLTLSHGLFKKMACVSFVVTHSSNQMSYETIKMIHPT